MSMSELVCALEDLHSRGIIHRDIKPANVLLTDDGHVVGLAKIFLPRRSRPLALPDHNQHDHDHDHRAGRVATDTGPSPSGAAVIATHRPYRGTHAPDDDDDVTCEKMGTLAYAAPEVRLGLPCSYSVDFWSLGVLFYVMLTGRFPFGMLGENYTLRFEPVEVDDGAQALLEKISDINPSKRPNIHKIKAHRFFSSVDWETTAARNQPVPITPGIHTHLPQPKTHPISFGTPYDVVSSNNDPMPNFTFTSSNFQQLRSEPARGVTPNTEKKSQVAGLFGWITRFAVKVGM